MAVFESARACSRGEAASHTCSFVAFLPFLGPTASGAPPLLTFLSCSRTPGHASLAGLYGTNTRKREGPTCDAVPGDDVREESSENKPPAAIVSAVYWVYLSGSQCWMLGNADLAFLHGGSGLIHVTSSI